MFMEALLRKTYKYTNSLYSNMTDEELIAELRKGNSDAEEYLFKRYACISKKIISSFYIVGAERDDLFQEAMLSLYKAVKEYRLDRKCGFKSYAITCMKRHIITVIRRSTRQKHGPLNNYISFSSPIGEENSGIDFNDKIKDDSVIDPENIIVSREREYMIMCVLQNNLSKFEKKVLSCYFSGLSYNESSVVLNTDSKAIDNALQRIKKKMRDELKTIYN